MKRWIVACISAWIVVGGVSGVASAHAEFGQSAVTAGTTSTVTLYVPQEYPGYFNVQVQVQIPSGWQAIGAAGNVLTFSNAGGLGEEFPITVIAPASPSGPAAFAVRQTYNAPPQNGGDGGAFCDPPTNRVVCWYYSATLSALAPPTPSPTPAPPTPAPTTNDNAANGGTQGNGGTTPQTATATEPETPSANAAVPVTGSASTVAGAADQELALGSANASNDGPSALPFLLLAGVVLLAAASGTVLIRRSNATKSTEQEPSTPKDSDS